MSLTQSAEITPAMRKWRPYPKYKDSGVEWLGKIPEHWEVKALKHACSLSALYGANEPSGSYAGEGVRFLRTTDINDAGSLNSDAGVYLDESLVGDYLLEDGDLLISRSGTIGRSFLYDSTLHGKCAYAGYLVRFKLRPENFPQFVFYFTKSTAFFDWLGISAIESTIGNVNGQKYANLLLVFPSPTEQPAIAAFLDRETAKIDTSIAKKERLIELLQEKRAAIISHAVTKGLDPNVPMKDSGIEWLGKIPAHWEVKRLKFLTVNPLQYGANEAGLLADPGQPRFVRITDITENGELREDTFRSLPHDVARPFLLSGGDLLLARSGATVGKSFMYKDSWGACCYAGYLIRARLLTTKILPEFINYFAASTNYWDWISASIIQATIQNVSAEKYGNLSIPLPGLEQQRRIIVYLDRETAKINALTAKVRDGIEKLKEYRTAIISAAVTGKIDVRDGAVSKSVNPPSRQQNNP